jgi:hypothetical protein
MARYDDDTGGARRRSDEGAGLDELAHLNVDQLQRRAAQRGIEGRCRMGKDELLRALTAAGT